MGNLGPNCCGHLPVGPVSCVKRKEASTKRAKRVRGNAKGEKKAQKGKALKKEKEKKLQHPDFARGPPPHYYPGQDVLNFADQTGCGALTTVWP